MFETLFSFIFILWSGYAGRHRGGGPPSIYHYLKKKIGFGFRHLYSAAFLMLFPAIFLYLSMLSLYVAFMLSLTWALYVTFMLSLTWIVWGQDGWGSYMVVGQNPNHYIAKPEVGWIDWILYWIWGPMWIPKDDQYNIQERKTSWSWKNLLNFFPLNLGFIPGDVVHSPTGDIRPFKWRQHREWLGMTLRGLHSIWFFVFLGWHFGNWSIVLGVIPFAILFGGVYRFFYSNMFLEWLKTRSWRDKRFFKNSEFWTDIIHPHFLAEWTAGLLWGVTIVSTLNILI